MKKLFLKILPLLLITVSVVTSCSNEGNEEPTKSQNESSNLTARISSEYGSLEFENKTVTINKIGYSKYVNDSLQYDFDYDEEIDYVIDETENEVIVSNVEDSSEFFKIRNIVVEEDKIVFNVLTSNGELFENIEYYADSETLEEAKFCVSCWMIGPTFTLLNILFDDTPPCQAEINSCLNSGGLPTVTITSGIFSSSCSVTCKPKP
ncbi:hypothetical protein FLJC2902T_12190 [Flavobacterium limnosediminis JC2902]|uniref:Lipoprotein n=1 Tax=Flavobacterium limnosediminis JC2902 TaxID=1341181 RepID=V6SSN7_9FLAO|nr:hypothetical protein [Flavobacterium limnosediminis]ESU29177.1 hypothetical protein FLJC2902T_12190 [Flavobacterium limnosediminis JC2902]